MAEAESECIFCAIAAKKSPADYVFEDEVAVGFFDINPKAPTHVLLIPRRHVVSLNHAAEEHSQLLGQLLLRARLIAEKLGIDKSGYRVLLNTGPDSGMIVHHLHLHILGGKKLSRL